MLPRVSVLIGVYNCAETVGRSIESIIAQSFADWEMIICDDGSTDNTVKIIERYVVQDPRIKLIQNEENRGLAFTLNHCLEYAKGEYCARMDGDDICDVSRFEKEITFLDAHPEYGFVSTTMKRFDEHGVYQNPPVQEPYEPILTDYIKGSPFCHAPAMLRSEAYKTVGGYRDIERTRQMEDYDLWFRMYAAGIKGCILREPLYSMFDGKDAVNRRTFHRRINEAWVRWHGYSLIHAPILLRIYVFKPLFLGLFPAKLLQTIKRKFL